MASNLRAMASNLGNLLAMASNLRGMVSNLLKAVVASGEALSSFVECTAPRLFASSKNGGGIAYSS